VEETALCICSFGGVGESRVTVGGKSTIAWLGLLEKLYEEEWASNQE
jgi:hypothetical protein